MKKFKIAIKFLQISTGLFLTLVLNTQAADKKPTASSLSGSVVMDGSSTVFPISEAVGEEFQKKNAKVKVAVAVSGTGGGFKKFCKGELDLTGASRPIESQEIDACGASKINYIELPVAYDGIALVVNKKNDWAKTLTIAELKKIWESGSKISNWKEVRTGFPDVNLKLFGPGHDSGTFDYFTKAVNEKEKSSRTDFTASEDDNTLVKGVAGEKGGLGYFGIAYYENNEDQLGLVAVDGGKGPVLPSAKTIADGTYAPLSRPLFIYASTNALKRPEVKAFVEFYLAQVPTLAPQVGYVALPPNVNALVKTRFDKGQTGTMYTNHMDQVNLSLVNLLSQKAKETATTKK